MRSYRLLTTMIVALPIVMLSCQKKDLGIDNPEPPVVPVPTDPPQSLSYKVSNDESINLSFKYTELPGKVSVYYDDTATEDKFDHLFATYNFNSDGYLTGNTFYTITGDVKSNITVQRSNNTIKSITVEPSSQQRSTFQVSFSDSAGAPDYTFMYVDYSNYFENIPVAMRFVYNNDKLVSSSGGTFTSGDNTVFFPSLSYRYNGNNRLESKVADLYYGADYSYEYGGKGLDSLFRILGGKDWHYMESILNYDENTSIFFYPLYITLSKNSVDIDIYMHRYGSLLEVSSIPNGEDYPEIERFNFLNSFDDNNKITQTTIFNNGDEYASYQFQY
ncbi:MAG: hypothetical protein QM668_22640 [Agriterribacter sp.]